jgi:hypothetical protein
MIARAVVLMAATIAGVASAESYLLVHADSTEGVDRPTWLALRSRTPDGRRDATKHYPLDGLPELIALEPRIYLILHLDFTRYIPSYRGMDKRTARFGPDNTREYGVRIRSDTITYFGDFLSKEGYGAIGHRGVTQGD